MSPHRHPIRNSTGSRGIREWLAGNFAAEITVGGWRCWLGTFGLPDEGARTYNAMWRFNRLHQDMNLLEIQSGAEEEMLVSEPRLALLAERRRHNLGFPSQRGTIASWLSEGGTTLRTWSMHEENYWAAGKAERQRKAFADQQLSRQQTGLPTIPFDK
jgi:hypothetical protein